MARPVVVRFIGDPKSLSGATLKIEGQLGGLKRTLIGLGIGRLLFGEFRTATDAALEHSNAVGSVDNKIRNLGSGAFATTDQITQLADAIQDKTSKDRDAVLAGEDMLLTFHNVRNEAGAGNDVFNQATEVLTDMTAQMNDGNVTSQGMAKQAIQLGKALNDPIAGLSALRRVGVAFTAQQTAQIHKLQESGDTLGAQKIILAELASEFGGAAAASSTSVDTERVAVKKLQESIGELLLPIVNAANAVLGRLAGIAANNRGAFLALAGAVVVITALIVADTIAQKVHLAVTKAVTIAQKAAAAAQWLLNAAMSANPIGLVVAAIALIVGALVRWYLTSQRARDIVSGAFRAITSAAQAVWDWIRGRWPLLLGVLTGPIGLAVTVIIRHFDQLKRLPAEMLEVGRRIVQGIIDGVKSRIRAIADTIRNVAQTIRDHLPFSPAKEGPLSGRGSPELGGRNIVRMIASGIDTERDRLRRSMGGLFPPGAGVLAPALPAGASVTVNAHTNASAAEIASEVAWAMRFSGR